MLSVWTKSKKILFTFDFYPIFTAEWLFTILKINDMLQDMLDLLTNLKPTMEGWIANYNTTF